MGMPKIGWENVQKLESLIPAARRDAGFNLDALDAKLLALNERRKTA